MTAVLGRMATYSGQVVRWDDAVAKGPGESPERIALDAVRGTCPALDGRYPFPTPGELQGVLKPAGETVGSMEIMIREADDGRQEAAECIRVHGARTHNLQNIDISLPRDRLVVVTGPSGSGKSSLAFDTLYAEGQRQYIESLSPYARQFLHQLERPDVDLIEGLQPTISIDQRAGSHNPRSTVATVTEIYDYLRLLYARLAESTCHQCGMAIRQQSPEQILEALLSRPAGTRMMILAPIVRGRKGQHREAMEGIRKAGFVGAIDGEVLEVNEPPELVPQKARRSRRSSTGW